MLLYILPVAFGLGGVAFPIGVLLYWTTSNLWTMGQQFYVIRNNPAPGTPAAQAKADRDRLKAEKKAGPQRGCGPSGGTAVATIEPEAPRPAVRQQPKRQTKAQRQTKAAPKPAQKNPAANKPAQKKPAQKKPGPQQPPKKNPSKGGR